MSSELEKQKNTLQTEQILSSYFGIDIPPIFRATFTGDIVSLRSLLKTPENVKTDAEVPSLLYFAIIGRQPEVAATLLSAGVDPTRPESDIGRLQETFSPIELASYFGNDAILALLIDHGVKIPASTLGIAASLDRVKCLEVLLERMDGKNFSDASNSKGIGDALERASLCWHIQSVKILLVYFKTLEHDINLQQLHLNRALGNAVRDFDCEHQCRVPDGFGRSIPDQLLILLDLLFDHGADINFRCPEIDWCPFTIICEQEHEFPRAIAYYFLQKGLLVNEKANRNNTPLLSYVVEHEDAIDFVEAMIAKGANVRATDINMLTPLHQPLSRAMAKLLVQSGADVTAKDNQGRSPLHAACQREDEILVEYLISAGGDIQEVATERNWTPLHFATCRDPHVHIYRTVSIGMIEVLLKYGADIDAVASDGTTSLHGAAAFNPAAADAVGLLLDEGADVNCTTENGSTPLHLACSVIGARGLPTVHVLLNRGADLEARNREGQTPLHLALHTLQVEVDRKVPDVVNLLLQKGANRLAEDAAGKRALELINRRKWYFDDKNLLREVIVLHYNRSHYDRAAARVARVRSYREGN